MDRRSRRGGLSGRRQPVCCASPTTLSASVLKLVGNVPQHVPAHRVKLPVGVEKANHAFRLLERLNQSVQQDAIKATVLPSNAVPVVSVEGVHEVPPADPSSAG